MRSPPTGAGCAIAAVARRAVRRSRPTVTALARARRWRDWRARDAATSSYRAGPRPRRSDRLPSEGCGSVGAARRARSRHDSGADAAPARPVLSSAGAGRTLAGGGWWRVRRDGRHRNEPARRSAWGTRRGWSTASSIDTLMSHLACADEARPPAERDRSARDSRRSRPAWCRHAGTSLANSAGHLCIGAGLRLRPDAARVSRSTAACRAPRRTRAYPPGRAASRSEVLQVRQSARGRDGRLRRDVDCAANDSRIAILNIGYADGYARAFSNVRARAGGGRLASGRRTRLDGPARGRCDGRRCEPKATGLMLDPDLADAARSFGCTSQYELLTGLGRRYQRRWT